MSEGKNVDAPARIPRWVKFLLVASLAINLLVIGLAAGAAWRFSRNGPPDVVRGGFAFVAALEKKDRRAMLSQLRNAGRDARQVGREDMREILDLLRAENVDAAALDTLMSAQVARGHKVQNEVKAAILDQIGRMDASERLVYADRLQERLEKGHRRPRAE